MMTPMVTVISSFLKSAATRRGSWAKLTNGQANIVELAKARAVLRQPMTVTRASEKS